MRILAENKEADVRMEWDSEEIRPLSVRSKDMHEIFSSMKMAFFFYDKAVEKALARTTPPSDLEKMTKIAKELISLADEWIEEFRYADLAEEFDQLTQPPKPIVKEGWINLYDSQGGKTHCPSAIIYSTRELAVEAVGRTPLIDTIQIKWEE